MAHKAICDNGACGRQADLVQPYSTTPLSWFTLRRIGETSMALVEKHACSIDCLTTILLEIAAADRGASAPESFSRAR